MAQSGDTVNLYLGSERKLHAKKTTMIQQAKRLASMASFLFKRRKVNKLKKMEICHWLR